MKFNLSLLLSGALSVSMSAYADSVMTIDGIASGISPDASLVVGTRSPYGDELFASFLYNVADGSQEWLTIGDDYFASPLEGGRFTAVNKSGVIVGAVHNPDMRLPKYDGPYYTPPTRNFDDDEYGEAISSAAVWRNGKLYVLGCGPYTIDFFSDSSDGSIATGISEDGNIVFGNIVSAWMPIEACIWEYDEMADEYVYRSLARPANAMISSIIANAENGFPVIGSISVPRKDEGFMTTALWLSPDEFVSINLPVQEIASAIYAHAISANGRYVAISASGNHPSMYVYDIETALLEPLELPAATTSVTGYTITNDGNIILKIQDSNWRSNLYYYDHASGSIVTLADYFADTMPDYTPSGDLSYASIIATTGDGKNIILRDDTYNYKSKLLSIDNPQLLLAPSPTSVDLYHTSISTLEVKFSGISSIPEGCVLKGYKVYVDGAEVKEIETTVCGETYYVETAATVGVGHSAYVRTVYEKNGEIKLSGKSPAVTTYVSSDLSLINFYDFDDSTIDGEGNIIWDQDTWQAKTNYGIAGEFINWHFSSNDFENRTPAVTVISAATEPWSSLFVSHYMDASEEENFYVDLRYQLRLVNTADQNLATDWLDVEASCDGRNWIKVASVNAAATSPYVWHTLHADLGSVMGGKVFQLRLNAHGEGEGQVMWNVDEIAIGNNLNGEQPSGLRYTLNDGGVKIMWRNALGQYDLSYLDNSAILWDYNFGNEGKPLIGAIEFTPDQTEPFAGEYINAVTTFLYDDPSIAQDAPTTAEAIVYVDGEEVVRAPFDSEFNTVEQAIAKFDTPIAIEKGKTYRVGVRISNYAYEQAPMYYQAASSSVAGRSDLYSEDEGRTWHKASEAAVSDVNPLGLCSWPVRVHISSEFDENSDLSDLLYYDIFRDGIKINEGNIYEPHAWVEIPTPFEGKYTVQAHYKGGVISPMSEILDLTNVSGVDKVFFTLQVSTGHGTVNINGECEEATLYDMSGRVIATTKNKSFSGLSAGVYMLKATTPSGIETYKVIVK